MDRWDVLFKSPCHNFPVDLTSMHVLRNTFTTRMLFTVVPSEMYDKGGATLQGLLNALVEDLNQLYENGVEALHRWTKCLGRFNYNLFIIVDSSSSKFLPISFHVSFLTVTGPF